MASTGGKQKRKVWFAMGNGKSDNYTGIKVPSNWKPGRSKNKYKEHVVVIKVN